MVTDLLFYQPGGAASFFQTEHATIELLASHKNWRANWTHIVPGNFGGDSLTDLLFYDAITGEGEFCSVDGIGGLKLLRMHSGWRSSWTHIIPGNFGRNGRTDLLFYDASDGTGEFYATRGPGDIVRIAAHVWSTGWTHIVPGSFGGNGFTDLFFYNPELGEGAFYAVDEGQSHLIDKAAGYRNTWNLIVPGRFGGSGGTDLLFYDADAGLGDFYSTGQGRLHEIRKHNGWRRGWKKIVAGDFGGAAADDLLFYEPASGTGEFYEVKDGGMTMLRTSDDWQPTWTHIVPGLYAPPRAVRIHVKVIYAPDGYLSDGITKDSVEEQITNTREAIVRAGIRVIVGSTQMLDPANGYEGPGPDIDKGSCSGGFFGDNISGDMWELFKKYDDEVGPNDLAIYWARNLYDPDGHPAGGCARHPNGKPGAVISNNHQKYVLAHEIGHVLGLDHTDDPNDLMFDGDSRTAPKPPLLDAGEIDTMRDSPYTIDL